MKHRFIFIFVCLCLAVQMQAQNMTLYNINIVDVEQGKILPCRTVEICNGNITKISSAAEHLKKGQTDCTGRYLLPGLINAHFHLANNPEETREDRIAVLSYMLHHGITSIRDAAGDARILKDLQNGVRSGEILAPDIYYAAFVAGPSYYKDNNREANMVVGLDTPFAPWLQCICPGDDLSLAMRSAKECGATGIKIYGGFSREELPPIVAAAHREGLEVWGHATLFSAKPTDVADAGVEVLSHAYMLEWEDVPGMLHDNVFKNYEAFYGKINHSDIDLVPFIRAMKAHNAIFDPTLYLCMHNEMEWSAPLVARLHAEGIRLCAGTDYIEDLSRPHTYLLDELLLYVEKCGLTPLEAIRTATTIAAETIGAEERIGSIAIGKQADLLILCKNPLEDIRYLTEIHTVVKRGIPLSI